MELKLGAWGIAIWKVLWFKQKWGLNVSAVSGAGKGEESSDFLVSFLSPSPGWIWRSSTSHSLSDLESEVFLSCCYSKLYCGRDILVQPRLNVIQALSRSEHNLFVVISEAITNYFMLDINNLSWDYSLKTEPPNGTLSMQSQDCCVLILKSEGLHFTELHPAQAENSCLSRRSHSSDLIHYKSHFTLIRSF